MATGLDTQQTIFAGNPDDRRAFEALEEHFFLEGDWQTLADLYRRRISAPSVQADPALQSPLLFRLGQILEERILDLPAASDVYWQLARLEPGNRPALRQLRGIHERAGQWDLVLQIAELEGQTTMPPYERAAFEAELGRTWHRQISDPEEAQRAYERALEADPDCPAALEGLSELHREAGRPEQAAVVLERLAARLRGPERAPVWIALGTLYAGALSDPGQAARCFAAALEDDPFQTPAVEWGLLLSMAAEDWPSVAELLERRFDLAAGARHRAAIAVEASQIQLSQLGSTAGARAWVDRAVELAHDDLSVLLAQADVERVDGDPDALVEILDRVRSIGGPHAPRAALVEAARLHAHFGNPEKALAALKGATEKSGPNDGEVLALHARLLRETGAKSELVEVLETLTAIEGSQDIGPRAEHLRELARLYEEDLGDAASAQGAWQRAFDLEPTNGDAQYALEQIHRKTNDWSALRAMLETTLGAAGATGQSENAARLGELLLDHYADPLEARRHFETALAEDPACRTALSGLRRIAEQSGDPDLLLEVCEREATTCVDPARMAELVRTMLPILEARGRLERALEWTIRWSRLAPQDRNALERRAGFEALLERPAAEIESRRALARQQTGVEKSTTLRRISALHALGGDDESSALALEQAREAAPGELETLTELAEVYRRLSRARELAQILRQQVDQLPPNAQAAPLEELADILQDPLGDLETAIVTRWRLVELPSPPTDAHEKLENLLDSAGRYAELTQLLDSRRQHLGDESDEAFALDLRRARLRLDALGHSEDAAEIFAALHERHPEDESVLDDLERALRVGDDARGLCDLLERRAGWEEDESRRVAIHFERATLLEESLGETLAACDLYAEIAQDHAGTEHASIAIARLESLLESSGAWSRLRGLLSERVETLPESEQPSLRERIARICSDRLNDMAGCAEQYEAIARIAPDLVHVWQELESIYAHELDRPSDWLRVVEAELASEPTPEREFTLRVAAGRLCLDDQRRPRGRDAREAYAHYERVLELEPHHAEAAEVLAMHHNVEGRPAEAARVLETRLAHLDDAARSEASDLRLRLARIYAGPVNDLARARELFEAAREALGSSVPFAEPLADVYERLEDPAALAGLCREILEAASVSPLLPWRVRLGTSERQLGHLEDAAVAYRAALIDSPDDRELEDALIAIYREVGETEPLAELLEKRLPYAQADEALAIRLELASIHADGRGEPREALAQLEQILASHPQHRDALDQALALAEALGDLEKQLELLECGLATRLPRADRAEFLERRGHLIAHSIGKPERALPSFREALALDPDRASARSALRALLESLGRWPAVLDCLFVEAAEADGERRVEMLEEAVELAWERVSPDAALPWLVRLRTERPQDPDLCTRIAEVHRRAGRFEAVLRAMDEELALRSDPGERCELHLQRARLLERDLSSPSRAILAFQQALELTPRREDILVDLDRLYGQMGRPFERASILEARVASLTGDAAIEMRRTLASLYCVDLSQPERAIPHLLRNVEATRQDPTEEIGHLGALDAALRASARFDAWVRVAERELELIEGHAEIRDSTPSDYIRFLREELARVYDEEIGDPDRAIAQLRILAATEASSAERSRAQLRDLLRRTGRRAELAECLAMHLDSAETRAPGEGTAREWLELGRLREETLLDWSGAASAYEQARQAPETALDAIRGLRRCCERLRDWAGLADALDHELARTDRLERNERVATARRLGDICWQRLAAGERAAAAYETALELSPTKIDLLRALTNVHEACGHPAEALPLYRRELDLLGNGPDDAPRRREVWLRVATLQRDAGDAPREAIESYCAADAVERLSAPDELCLARLYESEGELEDFRRVFGQWCDRADSGADVADHLELARHLDSAGEREAARSRARQATGIGQQDTSAWLFLAELERDAGRLAEAADAFDQAARTSDPESAARLRVEAAAVIEDGDPDRAHALLASAVAQDPASIEARIALVRAADRLGRAEETAREAETVMTLADARPVEPSVRLEIALIGGRAAGCAGHRDAARRLFGAVLAIEPDRAEALEGAAEAHFADGDFRAARSLLERRIDQPGENPEKGRQLAMIARGLEAEALLDAAWSRYEEAIDLDSGLDAAHEGLVRVHERAARTDEALAALERWIDASPDPERRAQTALRAAEAAWALEDVERAREHLETATRSNPQLTPAWLLLCEIVARQGSDGETRRVCTAALDAIEPSSLSAPISLRLARLEEAAGHREIARERYGEAVRWEPRLVEAVLCESRLARLAGDWVAAEGVLAHFVDAHPDPSSPSLAHVFLERGRLLSGPLEDFAEAILAYERALALQPDLHVARTALAGLLLHAPGREQEALEIHRSILESAPTSSTSLRALVTLAERRGKPDLAEGALSVLRALGQASPEEASTASHALRFAIHSGPPMARPEAEQLRSLAHLLREELDPVLADVEDTLPSSPEPRVDEAIRQIAAVEAELTAPRIARMPAQDRGRFFDTLAALFLDPGGNGGDARHRAALEQSLGRWTRRKARRLLEETDLAAIEVIDHEAWGHELRAMAAAQVVDGNGGDLRSVLRAMLALESANPARIHFEAAEIGALASTSEPIRRLLTRIISLLCERLQHGR